MTIKRRSVEESVFAERTMKSMKLDSTDHRAVQVVTDMAYHGSPFQYQRMMGHNQQYMQMHAQQFAGVEQMQQHAIQEMLSDQSAASSPEPMDCMDAAAHHVPTHRFISSCVTF